MVGVMLSGSELAWRYGCFTLHASWAAAKLYTLSLHAPPQTMKPEALHPKVDEQRGDAGSRVSWWVLCRLNSWEQQKPAGSQARLDRQISRLDA